MSLDVLELVLQASLIVQLVLLVLVALSIFSWAVILFKRRELSSAQQDSEAFLEIYHGGSLEESFRAAKDLDRSPLAAVFLLRSGATLGAISENHPLDPPPRRSTARRAASPPPATP